ncbi:uncharacterized protein LOC128557311 [Mercenaria mercenaria]|uniref:uncharacterized protein LOC128557311 n=1 Tax=Mercenaria mercenaria TaxID=6596 RepID=UPI00234F7B14|nr:uncharacterized protein LOC128557311 [Mercenaria mercenaria]XP_053400553.1 uncharacterized protein LOC128557311 [Mercenaria mercenaria]
MAMNRKSIRDLEAMRGSMHECFHKKIPILTTNLLKYADDLDKAYKDIKISKIAGQSGCVVGGVLAVVGFGLSFVTFGASLGLCIAGGVIGGAGGVTTGGASIADSVKARDAKKKAEVQLKICNEAFCKILEDCKLVSDKLERIGEIEIRFPFWCKFWRKLMFGSGNAVAGFGWKMVANTIINAVRMGKAVDTATDVTSAVVPVFRTLGNTAKGFHIAGGVVSTVFLPFDIYSLVSNSVELHTNEAHDISKRIRQAVKDIQDKCPKKEEIDDMIDKCIAVLRQ